MLFLLEVDSQITSVLVPCTETVEVLRQVKMVLALISLVDTEIQPATVTPAFLASQEAVVVGVGMVAVRNLYNLLSRIILFAIVCFLIVVIT